MGRKQSIGIKIRQAARSGAKTVIDIVRETDAKPNTVRVVLSRMRSQGDIHITRFYRGRSARAIQVNCHDGGIETRLNALICGFCGSVKASE